MEKEKLIIKNFGPIKDIELDLGRFNILIGEQATGKSTVAKVLAVCRYFSFIVEETRTRNKSVFSDGLELWGLFEYQKEDSLIEYHCKHYSLIYRYNTGVERIHYDDEGNEVGIEEIGFTLSLTPISEDFKNLMAELDKVAPKSYVKTGPMTLSLFRKIPTSFYLNDVKKVMDNPFYLPTERGLQSIFSLGRGGIPNLAASFLFNYFSKTDNIFDSYFKEVKIDPLDITYVNQNGDSYVKKNNNTVLLKNAASGYQSTIPIVLVVQYYLMQERKKTFIIEEPELNLFPTAQDKLMQFLVDKTVNVDNRVLLTTHSPYILSSINNMIYAYWVGLVHPEEIKKIITEKYWLNPDDVSAYRLLNNGTGKNILDNSIKQIDVGELDEVSGQINDIWDKIANVEFDKKYYED